MIAAGGTGGHIYPALAVAESLKRKQPDLQIYFVGTATGLENNIIPRAGYPVLHLPIGRLNRNVGFKERFTTVIQLPLAFIKSVILILKVRPLFLLGVGGHASGPLLLMGAFLRFKTVIWEPNAHPGLANRLLSRFVTQTLIVFESARSFLQAKSIKVVGMPIREEMEGLEPISRDQTPRPFRVLIFGGSQGARGINNAISSAVADNPEWLESVQLVHQTGAADYQRIKDFYVEKSLNKSDALQVFEYLHDMETRYAWADLVVCRSGTGTLSELAATGCASLLIPFPFASDNHQQRNAEVLVQAGAAKMLLQKDLTPVTLKNTIDELRKRPEDLQAMRAKIRQFHRPRAADEIADLLLAGERTVD